MIDMGPRKRRTRSRRRGGHRILVATDEAQKGRDLEEHLRALGHKVKLILVNDNKRLSVSGTYDGALMHLSKVDERVELRFNRVPAEIRLSYVLNGEGRQERTQKSTIHGTDEGHIVQDLEQVLTSLGLIDLAPSPTYLSRDIAEMEAKARHDPTNASLIRALATAYWDIGQIDIARDKMEEAHCLAQTNTDILLDYARLNLLAHQTAKAAQVLSKIPDGEQARSLEVEVDLERYKDGEVSLEQLSRSILMMESVSNHATEGSLPGDLLVLLLAAYCERGDDKDLEQAGGLFWDKLMAEGKLNFHKRSTFESTQGGLIVEAGGTTRSFTTTYPAHTKLHTDKLQIKIGKNIPKARIEIANYRALKNHERELVTLRDRYEVRGGLLAERENAQDHQMVLPRYVRALKKGVLVWPRIPFTRLYSALEQYQGSSPRHLASRLGLLERVIDNVATLQSVGAKSIDRLKDMRDYSEPEIIGGSRFITTYHDHKIHEAIQTLKRVLEIDIGDDEERSIEHLSREHISRPLTEGPDFLHTYFCDAQIDNWLGEMTSMEGNVFQNLRIGRVDFETKSIKNGILDAAEVVHHELARLNETQQKYLFVRWAAQRLAYNYLDEAEHAESPDEAQMHSKFAAELVDCIPASFEFRLESRLYDTTYRHFKNFNYSKAEFLDRDVPAAVAERHLVILGYQVSRLGRLAKHLTSISRNKGSSQTFANLEALGPFSEIDVGQAGDTGVWRMYNDLRSTEQAAKQLSKLIYRRSDSLSRLLRGSRSSPLKELHEPLYNGDVFNLSSYIGKLF
jgi:hypothetical protein